MFKLKIDPLQLPILYHQKLLHLFNSILDSTDSIRRSFKIKLGQTFKITYWIEILAEPDIFSNNGIQAQLNFLLK
jgi:hypothetical protein